jgi:TrmH family RNA methyltransferase
VDVYSSKVVRSAMGALNKINIFYLDYSEVENLKQVFKANDYALVATDLKAERYINECKVSNKLVFVLGNEANGVSSKMKELCDDTIKISMEDTQESLNVGVAAAILMYDLYVRGE